MGLTLQFAIGEKQPIIDVVKNSDFNSIRKKSQEDNLDLVHLWFL
jgi:hypothetical protein